MNIWLVTIGEPLPVQEGEKKLRTSLLADCLIARNHSVTLFASAFDHLKKKWIYDNDESITLNSRYKLEIMKGGGYKKNISFQRFSDHRIISSKFELRAAKLPLPDIIVASMPPHDLAHAVVQYGVQKGIPVITDIRDPWPDVFIQSVPAFFRSTVKLLLKNEFNKLRCALKNSTALFATTNTLLQWGLHYAGRDKRDFDRVFYLAQKNKIPDAPSNISNFHHDLFEKIKDKFIIFFVGTLSHYHSPLILTEAASKLAENENIHFVIAGTGQLFNEIQKRSQSLPNVTLTGWLREDEISFWLSKAKAGACTTPKHTDILPNKAGSYLSAGLPILSSFEGDLKLIIEKYECGIHYPANDVNALASGINKLFADTENYSRMSANADKLFNKLFNSGNVYDEYAAHVESVYRQFRNQ